MAVTFDVAQNLSDMVFYDASGGTYTARNTTTGDYFDNDSAVGDYIAFSWDRGPWHTLTVNVGTQLVADAITVVWEFQDSATVWTALDNVTDNTNAFQNAGSNTVVFDVPSSWHYQVYPGLGGLGWGYLGCYIRARITAVTNISEGGANVTDVISGGDWAININDAGTRLSDIQAADTAGSWGVTTTTGKYTAITSNISIVGGGEFYIRDNEFLEQGSNAKRTVFLKAANTLFQMGDATSGYSEGSMMLCWNNNGLNPYNYLASNVNIYNSILVKATGGYTDFSIGTGTSAIDIRNSVLATRTGNYMFASAAGTLENVTIDLRGNSWLYIYSSLTINNVILADVGGILAGAAMTLSNIDFGTSKKFNSTYASIKTLLNCNFDTSYTSQIDASYAGATAIVKYTVSLTIVDEDGVAIDTPTVVLTNAEGTDVFSGVWSTDFDASVWQEYGGVETDYNPFTITVSKAGYRTYTGVVTIDKKTDWDIVLDTGDTVIYDSTLYSSTIY